jgi:hypothetical protein
MPRRFALFEASVVNRFATQKIDSENRLAAREVRLVGWMFGFWTASLVVFYTLFRPR